MMTAAQTRFTGGATRWKMRLDRGDDGVDQVGLPEQAADDGDGVLDEGASRDRLQGVGQARDTHVQPRAEADPRARLGGRAPPGAG